jgi:hypothetical protein
MGGELLAAEGSCEEAALVLLWLDLDHEGTSQRQFLEHHCPTFLLDCG